MTDKTIETYNMDEDAMGLGSFIENMFAAHPEAIVVYVTDHEGNPITKARWVEETLTDGSIGYRLELVVDRI